MQEIDSKPWRTPGMNVKTTENLPAPVPWTIAYICCRKTTASLKSRENLPNRTLPGTLPLNSRSSARTRLCCVSAFVRSFGFNLKLTFSSLFRHIFSVTM